MTTAADALPISIVRTVTINAAPDSVFRFFTASERWAKWWGAGSTIDAKPGGEVYIRHPGNVESRGQVVAIEAPKRLVFTYGFVTGKPIPSGGSRVTILLEPDAAGTRLTLTHALPEGVDRDEHVQGWRFQLSLFANVVADDAMANASRYVDLWFKAWGDPDELARKAMLSEIATKDLRVMDRFSNLAGVDDVQAHLAAGQRFMPGLTMQRSGVVRHCQGTVLADWSVTGLDGKQRGSGTSVFAFTASGRVERVTGFWATQ